MCQVQRTTAWMSQATSGLVMTRQMCSHHLADVQLTRSRAHPVGRPLSIPIIGLPKTSSGAATSISTSCWLMCAENNMPPHLCRGDTNANASASQPHQKQAASQRRMPWPAPAPRQILAIPVEYQYAESANGRTTKASNSQARYSSSQLRGPLSVESEISDLPSCEWPRSECE